MNRVEIEIKLNRDRSWLLETLSKMSEEEMYAPRTVSEHDPSKTWSFADHFIHTTLIEKNWNAMFRRHLGGEKGMKLFDKPDGAAHVDGGDHGLGARVDRGVVRREPGQAAR